jgi:hypothetical protein
MSVSPTEVRSKISLAVFGLVPQIIDDHRTAEELLPAFVFGERRLVRIFSISTVLTEGFRYEDRHYPSLSAIAVAVTGTRWNGLAFFGLTRPVSGQRKERRHAEK